MSRKRPRKQGPRSGGAERHLSKSEPAYWKTRLFRNSYYYKGKRFQIRNWAVKIQHLGLRKTFSLRAAGSDQAAAEASRIYQLLLSDGWERLLQQESCSDETLNKFPSELTIAFRWSDRPLAWTYATICTQPQAEELPNAKTNLLQSERVRVAIVEPDTRISRALAWCVHHSEHFSCAGVYSEIAVAIQSLKGQPAQLILVNHSLWGKADAVGLERFNSFPGVPRLNYSVYEDSEELFRRTPGGASWYLLKRTSPTAFLEPLGNLAKGEKDSAPDIVTIVWRYFSEMLTSLPASISSPALDSLSQREHEVIALLSKGQPDKEIAERLLISTYTVHGHVRKIFAKLGVHNRAGAVAKYFQK